MDAAEGLQKLAEKTPASAPSPVIVPAGMGVESLPQKPKEPSVMDILMNMNRASRRKFLKQNGIKIPGAMMPVINRK
jgi:hypothetical protein